MNSSYSAQVEPIQRPRCAVTSTAVHRSGVDFCLNASRVGWRFAPECATASIFCTVLPVAAENWVRASHRGRRAFANELLRSPTRRARLAREGPVNRAEPTVECHTKRQDERRFLAANGLIRIAYPLVVDGGDPPNGYAIQGFKPKVTRRKECVAAAVHMATRSGARSFSTGPAEARMTIIGVRCLRGGSVDHKGRGGPDRNGLRLPPSGATLLR